MSNQKISQLNSLTKATVATTDVFPIVDTSASETKKISYQELIQPQDNQFRIAGSSDNTKLLAFEVDGLTTATTRTITVPDATGSMVLDTATQTLTNKTLTAPQINIGSDADYDLVTRVSGITSRLAKGAEGSVLSIVSGALSWISNPAASDASTTVKGVVEIATTAEITAGTSTGGTGAKLVVPADAVGATASKIVQLDSSARLPAVDGSLLTSLPNTSKYGINGSTTQFTSAAEISGAGDSGFKTFYVLVPGLITVQADVKQDTDTTGSPTLEIIPVLPLAVTPISVSTAITTGYTTVSSQFFLPVGKYTIHLKNTNSRTDYLKNLLLKFDVSSIGTTYII